MADQALYRKYRSANFSEVVGQDHVVKTLQAQLAAGRQVHAYLFTGPRGVGKTSVARLFARALACTGDPKPCNKCPGCLAAINSSLDIIEIDGASNRSIDAVRDLREKVNIAPTKAKYKVYIIDEVHMLTAEAFNALLKTLEEPPAHAVFILATTEAHKVPETIISRTQRFNFRPIAPTDLKSQLARIAEHENVNATPETLSIIAAAARGSFRDGISLLDQLAAGATEITPEAVRSLLGYTTSEEVLTLSRALAAGDAKAALDVTARLTEAGAQPAQVAAQLTDFWRGVLLAAAGSSPAPAAETAELAASVTPLQAARIVDQLIEVSRSAWPALALETAVVKLTASPEPSASPASAPAPMPRAASPKREPAVGGTEAVATEKADAGSDTVKNEETGGVQRAEVATAEVTGPATDTPNAALWPKVVVLVKSKNNSLAALLQMYPLEFNGNVIVIKPRFNFHRDIFNKPTNRSLLEAAAAKVYGQTVSVTARTDEPAASPKSARADSNTELLSSALEILGGEVVD